MCEYELKSRKYRGISKRKVRNFMPDLGKLISTIESKCKSQKGKETGIRKGKSSLLACHTRRKCSMKISRY